MSSTEYVWLRDEAVVVELSCGCDDNACVSGSSDDDGDAMSVGTRDMVDMPRMLAMDTSCDGLRELLMDVLPTDKHLFISLRCLSKLMADRHLMADKHLFISLRCLSKLMAYSIAQRFSFVSLTYTEFVGIFV